jgi:hypothetical protein
MINYHAILVRKPCSVLDSTIEPSHDASQSSFGWHLKYLSPGEINKWISLDVSPEEEIEYCLNKFDSLRSDIQLLDLLNKIVIDNLLNNN